TRSASLRAAGPRSSGMSDSAMFINSTTLPGALTHQRRTASRPPARHAAHPPLPVAAARMPSRPCQDGQTRYQRPPARPVLSDLAATVEGVRTDIRNYRRLASQVVLMF